MTDRETTPLDPTAPTDPLAEAAVLVAADRGLDGFGPAPALLGIPNITAGPTTRGAPVTRRPNLARLTALVILTTTVAAVAADVVASVLGG